MVEHVEPSPRFEGHTANATELAYSTDVRPLRGTSIGVLPEGHCATAPGNGHATPPS